jgi:hypothetical protein
MPEHIGVKVAEHLDRHQITDLTAIKNACVKPGKDKEWDKFWRWNNMVDDYRKEKFADVFPEYYKLLTS